jgi:predicted oxidoreductase
LSQHLQLSKVIAGTMKWGAWGSKFSTDQYLKIIEECISLGVTTFDHADIYGHYTTEADFGKALKLKPELRDQMQLISKCGICMVTPNRPQHKIKHYDTSREHIVRSVENSLANLHTEYLDMLLIHRPDPLMDPDEIAEAFAHLQHQGKVNHFGVSNFTPSQTELILSRFPLVTNQIELSVLHLEHFLDGTLDQCIHKNIVPMAWSPLGGGNLFAQLEDERNKRIVAVASMLADKYNAGPDQILLSWLIQHPSGVIPVLGTSRIERVQAAMDATSISMTREEWFMLWRASIGREIP